ncbi:MULTISPECIES: RNA polymerase sigma factor [unclassified Pedobacter]|uniref:RNA polymerase sigma factor n=1 Tax=unclassified Pedobacter TaxID=2628915 RepID=UPI00141FF323|nr:MULTISPECIES: sigma-70 family RNA polymerase sigma factor [unclassified Pedobacter]NII85928.1 RNA polymerase sigma-70 factor (ECF subfamily) [Pedobacter sp. SG908]NMN39157.1 RNA polymerase sigma-70 factor (ECF subfamily) [Pedobacter sp. SG918]
MAIKPLPNEKELLLEIANGDGIAFAELFRAYHSPLIKYIYTMLESVESCEEMVQDIFLKVWENREILPKLDKFTAYLFILTRNYTISAIRRMVKDKKHSQLYAEEVLSLNESEEIFNVDQEYQNILIKAIAELPPSQQRVLQLRQQGLKSRQIAGEMGISIESVKKYQQWATKSVSKFLKLHTAITISVILSMN